MQTEKKDIRALSKEQLRQFFVANGDKPFRGNQVYEWLWSKRAQTFEDMTNLSKETRAILEENFVINHIKVDTLQRSEDGTVKNAIRLHDDLIVESVLIPTETRDNCVCIFASRLQFRLQFLCYCSSKTHAKLGTWRNLRPSCRNR